MLKLSGMQGFTLIELMIVMVIIGILAAVAIPQMAGVKETANVSGAEAELKSLQSIMEMYYVENDEYPPGNDVAISTLGIAEITPGMETGPRNVDYMYKQLAGGQEWIAIWINPDDSTNSVSVTQDNIETGYDVATYNAL